MLALRHNTDTSFSWCCLIIIIAIHLFGSQYSLRCWDDVLYRFSPVVCVHVMTSDVVFIFWAENISWISKPWKCSFIHKYILLKLCSIGVTCDNGAFLDIILVGAKSVFRTSRNYNCFDKIVQRNKVYLEHYHLIYHYFIHVLINEKNKL